MRVSILNLNLVAHDAIGTCILNQMRFFLRRGDTVHVFTAQPARGVPAELADLTSVTTFTDLAEMRDPHFRLSDLYIYHYPSRHPLMDSIKYLERGAVVFYYHNVTPPELWNSSFARDELLRGVEGISLVHFADLAIADSPFNREDLVQRGYDSDRIHVLPLGVPLDKFKPGAKDPALVQRYRIEGKRVLVFVGRMASNKRIDLLVEALPLIRDQVPGAVLMFVGDADSSEPYRDVSENSRRRAVELGCGDAVFFTGVVDDLPLYYQLADLYVTASLHEGFGVPLVEAMASGVPVVASRATSHPWVVGEAGVLFEPGDATELAQNVVQLLRDDQRYGELVRRGLERAHMFSVDAYDAGFAEIADEAIRWVRALPQTKRRNERTAPWASFSKSPDFGYGNVVSNSLGELYSRADVMLRPYFVRSKIPLFGSLIAWVRRNLTSHLREPYLDPTLERQVSFNRQLVAALERMQEDRSERDEMWRRETTLFKERLALSEKRLELLDARLRLAILRQSNAENPSNIERLEAEVAAMTAALDET